MNMFERMIKKLEEDDDAFGEIGICCNSLFSGMGSCFDAIMSGCVQLCGKY